MRVCNGWPVTDLSLNGLARMNPSFGNLRASTVLLVLFFANRHTGNTFLIFFFLFVFIGREKGEEW